MALVFMNHLNKETTVVHKHPIVAAFDMDGTLIDCEPHNRAAVEEAAGGRYIDWLKMAGQAEVSIHAWIQERDSSFNIDPTQFVNDCVKGYQIREHKICARAGVVEALEFLREREIPIIIVTNTNHKLAVEKMRRAGLLSYLDTSSITDGILGKDDVIALGMKPKSSSDPYTHVAEMMKAEHLAIYEDSPTGMDSADSAKAVLHANGNMRVTIAHIYDCGAPPDSRADYVIDGRSPEDLIYTTQAIFDLSGKRPLLEPARIPLRAAARG